MKRNDLYYVLFAQQKEFEEDKTALTKRELTRKVISLMPLKMPVFITGVRRCGKSSLLRLIKEELGLHKTEWFYINFNDERLVGFSVEDFQKIIDFLNEQNYEENCFLLVDEIQEVDGWEKWIDRIKQKYNILITGSNSKLLSKEISAVLTGRSINVSLTPFNFREFLNYKNVNLEDWNLDLKTQSNIRREFKPFLDVGGFPKRVISGQKIILSELYENIIYRDIISKFGKSQAKQIKELSLYFLSNISNPVSLRALSKILQMKNISTVKAIMDSFEGAFLFFFINKFDYSIKKQIQNPRKVYCVDNGLVTTLGFRFSEDKGKFLENLVAIELKRRGHEIYYYSEKAECDFIVKDELKIRNAIQVCYDLTESNRDRELNGLVGALEKFGLKQGLILTYDQEDKLKLKNKKIEILPVWKWLLTQT